MKFRKKPVIIEAEQWYPGVEIDGVRPVIRDRYVTDDCEWKDTTITHGEIITLEGIMEVSPGDWVITGVKGEKYPCKPDIFELTYEPVE
jgi:hypothetical protein